MLGVINLDGFGTWDIYTPFYYPLIQHPACPNIFDKIKDNKKNGLMTRMDQLQKYLLVTTILTTRRFIEWCARIHGSEITSTYKMARWLGSWMAPKTYVYCFWRNSEWKWGTVEIASAFFILCGALGRCWDFRLTLQHYLFSIESIFMHHVSIYYIIKFGLLLIYYLTMLFFCLRCSYQSIFSYRKQNKWN